MAPLTADRYFKFTSRYLTDLSKKFSNDISSGNNLITPNYVGYVYNPITQRFIIKRNAITKKNEPRATFTKIINKVKKTYNMDYDATNNSWNIIKTNSITATDFNTFNTMALKDFIENSNIMGFKWVRIVSKRDDGTIYADRILKVRDTSNQASYKSFVLAYRITSDEMEWTETDTLEIYPQQRIPSLRGIKKSTNPRAPIAPFYYDVLTTENIKPIANLWFRDNTNNTCFFKPIMKNFTMRYDNSTSRTTKKNISCHINRLNEYMEKYKDGMPNDINIIQQLCNDLLINVVIYNIVGNKYIDIKCAKQAKTTIEYKNTRYNHVDEYYSGVERQEIHPSEMRDIVMKLNENKEKYIYCSQTVSDTLTPTFLQTNTNIYVAKTTGAKLMNIFKQTFKDVYFTLNDKSRDLHNYISCGIIYNGPFQLNTFDKTPRYKDLVAQKQHAKILEYANEHTHYKELDMKAAYTQFKECKYYAGFPSVFNYFGKLKNFTIEKVKKLVGYYEIANVDLSDCVHKNYVEAMGVCAGIYTSVELVYFDSIGVKFDIVSGAFCHTPFHFEFPDYMKLKKGDINKSIVVDKQDFTVDATALRLYCIFTGKMWNVNDESIIRFRVDNDEDRALLLDQCPNQSVKFFGDIATISTPKNTVKHLGHISGFITAYTRINLMEKLFSIDFNNVRQLKLDSIVYVDDGINHEDKLFCYKEANAIKYCGVEYYHGNAITNELNIPDYKDYCDYDKRIYLFNGQGGSGKTHTVLTDARLSGLSSSIMLVSACWKLIIDKHIEYGVGVRSIQTMIGENTEAYNIKNATPAIIVFDEITQNDSGRVKKLMDMYKYSTIVLIGDIDKDGFYYQCKFMGDVINKAFINKYVDDIITFKTNYRCQDPILMNKMIELRQMMRNNLPLSKLLEWATHNFKVINDNELKNLYEIRDTVLCSTKEAKTSEVNKYTSLLAYKGGKYIVNSHNPTDVYRRMNGDKTSLLTGEITYEAHERAQSAHAYTIHSFQGCTLYNRIFIVVDAIFDYQQLYTAISRSKNGDQIYLVKNK